MYMVFLGIKEDTPEMLRDEYEGTKPRSMSATPLGEIVLKFSREDTLLIKGGNSSGGGGLDTNEGRQMEVTREVVFFGDFGFLRIGTTATLGTPVSDFRFPDPPGVVLAAETRAGTGEETTPVVVAEDTVAALFLLSLFFRSSF
jgi:hypothetical protein